MYDVDKCCHKHSLRQHNSDAFFLSKFSVFLGRSDVFYHSITIAVEQQGGFYGGISGCNKTFGGLDDCKNTGVSEEYSEYKVLRWLSGLIKIDNIDLSVNLLDSHKPNSLGETTAELGKRHRLIPQAILLGLLTGSVSVAFHLCVDMTDAFRIRFINMAHEFGNAGIVLIFCYILVAILISAELVIRFAPEASGSGIPHLKAVLLGHRRFRWFRVLIIKFFSMVIGNAGGMVLGREGPSVQMGGAIGQGLATHWPGKGKLDFAMLVAAGGGAGLAAAFNAPLAGLTFVLEELERRCASLEFFAAAIACLTVDMVYRSILGQNPIFHFVFQGAPPLILLAAFLPLGVLAAILGSLFTRTLLCGQKLTSFSFWPKLLCWGILAAALTVVAWYEPELLGGGQNFVNDLLIGKQLSLQTVGLFFLIRFVLTMGSASSGVAGGIFMPILVLGALLGWAVGLVIQLIFPELNVDTGMFAVVGMAAYFSGVVQAPLTGIVLIIEMTQNYALIMPLFLACFTALIIADWFGCPPVYEALLALDLQKDRLNPSTPVNI